MPGIDMTLFLVTGAQLVIVSFTSAIAWFDTAALAATPSAVVYK